MNDVCSVVTCVAIHDLHLAVAHQAILLVPAMPARAKPFQGSCSAALTQLDCSEWRILRLQLQLHLPNPPGQPMHGGASKLALSMSWYIRPSLITPNTAPDTQRPTHTAAQSHLNPRQPAMIRNRQIMRGSAGISRAWSSGGQRGCCRSPCSVSACHAALGLSPGHHTGALWSCGRHKDYTSVNIYR